LLGAFTVTLAQSEADAARFRALGAANAQDIGNLKYDAPTLGHDRNTLMRLRHEIGARPLWLAASTHEGEEAVALAAHRKLAARWPDLLTLIVPRHPERAAAIVESCARAGLGVARRSLGEPITLAISVYLADTFGELGLFYALSGIVFVGGSLTPVGGHNALEPARLDCALIAGPEMANFADLQAALGAAEALVTVRDAETLAGAVAGFLEQPARRAAGAGAALRVANSLGGAVERTLAQLLPLLPENGGRKATAHARA
jgi:3-deoxy-D-manno-octulosonic-acid transferase